MRVTLWLSCFLIGSLLLDTKTQQHVFPQGSILRAPEALSQHCGCEAEAGQMFEVFVGNLEQADGLELIMVERESGT